MRFEPVELDDAEAIAAFILGATLTIAIDLQEFYFGNELICQHVCEAITRTPARGIEIGHGHVGDGSTLANSLIHSQRRAIHVMYPVVSREEHAAFWNTLADGLPTRSHLEELVVKLFPHREESITTNR